jgi:hypothetical protein
MSEERGPPTTGTPVEDEIRAVLERARGGDPEALPAAREALDADPGIWRAYGDLAAHARRSWIALIGGQDLVLKESLGRKLAEIEAGLSGPAASPLERLLVERVGACWLQLYYADAAAARSGEMSLKQLDQARRRQDSCHRRYLSAIGALAMTRRLVGSAVGTSGLGPGAGLPSTGPGHVPDVCEAVQGTGDRESNRVEGDSAERGLVLEFGPPREGAVGGQKTGGRRKPKVS